jgi:putative transposase
MKLMFHMVLIMLCEALSVRRDAHIRFLKIPIEIYESKLKGNRVIPDPAERLRLLEAGAAVGHDVKDTLMVVELKTYKRWLLELRRGLKPKKVGRPKLAQELIDLVVRFAKENASWGIDRIWGELRKVGVFLGRSSVKRVLKHEGLFPNPDRRNWKLPDTPWRNFLKVHMNSIVACDFLAKEILTPLGKKTAYLLIFIHLETRKVFLSPATYAPVEEWVVQQARNVRMWLEDAGIEQRFILRDNDKKFTDDFDEIFEDENMEVITIPYEAPNANAYASQCTSWVGSVVTKVMRGLSASLRPCCLQGALAPAGS